MKSRLLPAALAAASLTGAAFAQDPAVSTYELPGEGLHPEGIAYDSGTDSLFVSGAGTGEILRIDRATGEVSSFAQATGVPFSVLGLEVADGQLWAAGAGTGEIRAYSLADGSLTLTVTTGEGGLLNDLVVSSAGDVYVTDSNRPILYRLTAGSTSAEEWLDFTGTDFEYAEGANANGIVISDDEASLIIAQLNTGQLWHVDTATQIVSEIDAGETFPGADGLVLDGSTLYVIQNGADQVSVVELSADFTSGTVSSVLTHDDFNMPATAVLVDGQLIVTNTQFGALQGGEVDLPFRLSVVPLD